MTTRSLSLFEAGARLQMTESIELTLQSLRAYGPQHDHWVIAWSGGKDSTATLTVVLHFIATGLLAGPKRLTVLYADTRQELPPLALAAEEIMDELEGRGVEYRVVRAPLDKRFLVYILGRGVPPPNNNTLRWCTRQIKVDPMSAAIAELLTDGTALVITGVRQGESAIRDRRIEMSCGKDGAERLKDGSIAANPQRMGPLTLECRTEALRRILDIQARVNAGQRRPFELINLQEQTRIVGLIAAGTWPDGWNGDEPHADAWLEVQVFANGAEQPALFSAGDLS